MTLNPFRKIAPQLRVWVAICAALVIATAGATLGYLGERSAAQSKSQSTAAIRQASSTAQCLNQVLSLRQTPSAKDSTAYAEIFGAINDVFTATQGPAQQAAFATFEKVLAKDEAILSEDNAFRGANPLGKCG